MSERLREMILGLIEHEPMDVASIAAACSYRLSEGKEMNKINLPPIAEGETYIGAIGDQAGNLYHLILLPGDNDKAAHQAQMDWAKSIGGDLPNRVESAMLFAHAKDQFQPTWYWTNDTLIDPDEPEDDSWAWSQYFSYGLQNNNRKLDGLRARAVRRLPA